MRIIVKLSGASLKHEDNNVSDEALSHFLNQIKDLSKDNEIIVIPGGGNLWRGRNNLNIDKEVSDYMGMLSTSINALSVSSYLNNNGISSSYYNAFDIEGVMKKETKRKVLKDLKNKKVVVLGGGLGRVSISTDTAVISKAILYKCDMILMGKNVDGVYDKDPNLYKASKINSMAHEELYDLQNKEEGLKILDMEALELLKRHKIPMYIYKSSLVNNISEVLDNKLGTKIIS